MTRVVGVLALQGGFGAHELAIEAAGAVARPVRKIEDFVGLDGLVLPGGERTVQLRLLERHGLVGALSLLVSSGAPLLATCAGLILVAKTVERPLQASFGFLDVTVARNAWGRQIDSFEATADDGESALVFIRAPRILATGPGVEVLTRLSGEPVMVRQNNVFGATFHPELAPGSRVHAQVFS